MLLYVPFVQGTHCEMDVAPEVLLYVPIGQGLQIDASVAFVALLKVPAKHLIQKLILVAPSVME